MNDLRTRYQKTNRVCNPIEYRGFKIGIESLGGNYLYVITYLNVTGEVFDASPALYDSEEEAVEDAKYVIDKYHDTK